jgi:formylglycine-generating enzyme
VTRRIAAVAVAIALGATSFGGCSLVVDTKGLSGGDQNATPDGSPTVGDGAVPRVDGSADGSSAEGGVTGACPSGRGPAMLRVRDSHGTFCIDTTEVTNAQYDVMIDSASSLPGRSGTCSYKGAFAVAKAGPPNAPRVSVDWCDAELFCAWAGKRFCGSRDGTVIDNTAASNNAKVDEWYAACSKDGQQKYPYAGNFSDKKCNGCARTGACSTGGSPLVDVATLRDCEGGYSGLFDMAGNAAEWMDDCDDDGAGNRARDFCPPRGGDRTRGNPEHIACLFVDDGKLARREVVADDIGFRCCAN